MTKSDLPVRVLFLDLDGVVIESVSIKTEAFRELFDAHPEHLDEIMSYHLRNNSVSRFVKFKYIYEQELGLPFDDATREAVGRRFSDIVFQKVVACPLVVGAEALLQEFSGCLPIYVVSATPEEEVRQVVAARNLSHHFEGLYGTPGTKPEHIRRVLGKLQLSPSQGVFVGDSLEDYRAAQVAGVGFIGRQNQEEFGLFDIPILEDLVGVAGILRELMV